MEEKAFIFYEEWGKHEWYCGLDIHKHKLAVAIYSPTLNGSKGTKTSIFSVDSDGLAQFWNLVKKYRPLGFAMEATGIYHHVIYRLLSEKLVSCDWEY